MAAGFIEGLETLMRKYNDKLKDLVQRDWGMISHWVVTTNGTSQCKKPMNVHLKLKTVEEYTSYWQ